MSDAERGNVEPSAEAKTLLLNFSMACVVGFQSEEAQQAKAELWAYVARLESAASPPCAFCAHEACDACENWQGDPQELLACGHSVSQRHPESCACPSHAPPAPRAAGAGRDNPPTNAGSPSEGASEDRYNPPKCLRCQHTHAEHPSHFYSVGGVLNPCNEFVPRDYLISNNGGNGARAAGAGEVVAWGVRGPRGHLLSSFPDRADAEKDLSEWRMNGKGRLTLVPLYAGSAPPSGAGVSEEASRRLDMLEAAWGVIANVSGSDWTKQTIEWQQAAMRWRSTYDAAILAARTAPAPRDER